MAKPTTAHVIAEALQRLERNFRLRGHARLRAASARCKPGSLTTPDAITVHRQLAELRDQGVR